MLYTNAFILTDKMGRPTSTSYCYCIFNIQFFFALNKITWSDIAIGLLWYVILLFQTCLRDIRFELYLGTSIMLLSLIKLLPLSRIDMVAIFLVLMI